MATSSEPPSGAVQIAKSAKAAFEASQLVSSADRVSALYAIKDALLRNKQAILDANVQDLKAAKTQVDAGSMSQSLLSRLDLIKGDKWDSMLQGLSDVADLQDPNGHVSYASELDDDLELYRVSCPIGVLLVIFEARPEVVVNIAALAIKSGNAAILKGGKESVHTTQVLSQAISDGIAITSLPIGYIQTVQTRAEISSLLALDRYIDLVIPRGSNALVRNIQNNTRIPVMGHADGICNIYLDESADEVKATRIVVDAKTDYPSACNAVETLLVNSSLLNTVWPKVAQALLDARVTLLCDEPSRSAIPSHANVKPADPSKDYTVEHLTLTLSVLSVPSLSDAITHVNANSSHHTDSIITEDTHAATIWCRAVDSAGTYVNASTRFADGFRYGFGTEVGISTGRIHARGPVGLEGLVTYKYVLKSSAKQGHIAAEFGTGKKAFKHRKIQAAEAPF